MRVVFMGTPDFAAVILKSLVEHGHEVAAVFTNPDKPVGRKQIFHASPVKEYALSQNIKVYQPEKLKDFNAPEIIKESGADIVVVAAYGKILRKDVLEAALYGCVNVHASLLPKYRGAAPIQWAVLNGDKETGVSIMQMNEGLDTGDVILVKKTEIGEDETSEELFDRLSVIGADALNEALKQIENGTAKRTPQPKGYFGYAKMITKAMSPIDWSRPAEEIHNQVRGLQTWPAAQTVINGKIVKIHKTAHSPLSGSNSGEVVKCDKQLVVSCGDKKCLEILELQAEGKKRMDARSFLQGNKLKEGYILGE